MSDHQGDEKARLREALEAERDARQDLLSGALWDVMFSAITSNLPSAALALCAEEDVHTVIRAVIEDLDDDGLTVVPRTPSGQPDGGGS